MKYIFILSVLFLSSCVGGENEKPLETLDKKSAREVVLKTVSLGDSVLHITTQQIWFDGELVIAKSDTIKTAISPSSWGSSNQQNSLSKVPIYVTVQ